MLRFGSLLLPGRAGMRRARLILFFACFASATAAVSACGLAGFPADVGAGGAGAGGTTGAGDGDASVDIGSDGAPPTDPYERYAYLCGEGCRPGGDASDCAPGGDPGMDGSPTPDQFLYCQLVLNEGEAAPVCGPPGSFEAGGPCLSAADCGPGLGCVVEADAPSGVCRQYCCGNVEACGLGTYCAPQPMTEAVAAGFADVEIPVCVLATDCVLLDDSTCDGGQTCTIVRADGTTSCVDPGEGKLDEDCPCAPGFVCSMLTNECKQLCHLDENAADCDAGFKCQGASMGYPEGFGICVGEG